MELQGNKSQQCGSRGRESARQRGSRYRGPDGLNGKRSEKAVTANERESPDAQELVAAAVSRE